MGQVGGQEARHQGGLHQAVDRRGDQPLPEHPFQFLPGVDLRGLLLNVEVQALHDPVHRGPPVGSGGDQTFRLNELGDRGLLPTVLIGGLRLPLGEQLPLPQFL